MISIIIPTIKGREAWLERCIQSYRETTDGDYEITIMRDYPTCNAAWNDALKEVKGDVVHISADDIEAHPGWLQAGLRALKYGFLPCPRILNPDGTLQSCGDDATEQADLTPSSVARLPLFKREWVKHFYPFPDMQYMGDYWLSERCGAHGIPTLVVREYLFTHGYAQEGRLNTLSEDLVAYGRIAR